MSVSYRYAYLHGFASSSYSRKGLFLREAFRSRGVEMELPDLNVPSFEKLTYSAILDALDDLDGPVANSSYRWRIIGSSMGGYLAARWSELRPERLERAVLLCPGFDLGTRWAGLVGDEAMSRWRTTGRLELPDAEDRPRPVHWGFIEDSRSHPAFPEIRCPTLIIHGRQDEVVDIAGSRRYAGDRDHVDLVEVDDDHGLAASMERIAEESFRHFGLA